MLDATKPLNCILFVSFCCKFCFIPKRPFAIFTEHTMKAAWLEWGAVYKVPETWGLCILLLPFWYDWNYIFLLILCSLWAGRSQKVIPNFLSFDWPVVPVRLIQLASFLYRFGFHGFTCRLCLFPQSRTVWILLSPKPTLQRATRASLTFH